MPITAKLSRQFYDKLGDEIANELVTWLNAVDTSYRDEFRTLFEANFGRVEARLREFDARVEARLREMDARVDARLDRLEALLGRQVADLRLEMGRQEARLVRWMFGFWVTGWLAIAGTMFALQHLH